MNTPDQHSDDLTPHAVEKQQVPHNEVPETIAFQTRESVVTALKQSDSIPRIAPETSEMIDLEKNRLDAIRLLDDIITKLGYLRETGKLQIVLALLSGPIPFNFLTTIYSHYTGGREKKSFDQLKENIMRLRVLLDEEMVKRYSLEKAKGPGNSLIATFFPLMRAIRRAANHGAINEVRNQMIALRMALQNNESLPSSEPELKAA